MPVAIIGAVAAAGIGAATGATLFGLTVWETFFARITISLALSGLETAIAGKPKNPNQGNFAARASARTQQVTQAVTSRRLVYGEILTSGPIVYATTTQDNKYLHVVIVLAAHEVAGIDEVWLDQDVIPNDALDGSGNVISGKYAGYVRIKKHLGGTGQAADSDLVAEVSEWTSAHKLSGHAYIYLRYQQNQKVFPSGVPNAAAVVRGRRIYDVRTGDTVWTRNIELFAYDYLTDAKYGNNVDVSRIDSDTVTAEANSCDEIADTASVSATVASVSAAHDTLTFDTSASPMLPFLRGARVQVSSSGALPAGLSPSTDYFIIPVQWGGTPRCKLAASLADAYASDGDGTAVDLTDAGSGTITVTQTGEPRYHGGGQIDTAQAVGDNMKDILSGMGGHLTNAGGLWKIYCAVWRGTASEGLDEADSLRALPVITTQTSRASRFNTVRGTYVSPLNNWQPANYPQAQGSSFLDDDQGDVLPATLDLAFTQSSSTAQRLASITLKKARNEQVMQWPANLLGFQFEPADNVAVTYGRASYDGALFEVLNGKFVIDTSDPKAPTLGMDLMLQATSSDDYDWDTSGEVAPSPRPSSVPPDAFTVPGIVGLSVSSIAVTTKGGDTTYRVQASWDTITNGFVANGGWVHFMYRLSGDSVWKALPPVRGNDTTADLFSGELGQNYDLLVWLENSLGRTGSTYELDGLSIGSIGGVGYTNDWHGAADTVGTTIDYGAVTDSVGTTNDWGGVA